LPVLSRAVHILVGVKCPAASLATNIAKMGLYTPHGHQQLVGYLAQQMCSSPSLPGPGGGTQAPPPGGSGSPTRVTGGGDEYSWCTWKLPFENLLAAERVSTCKQQVICSCCKKVSLLFSLQFFMRVIVVLDSCVVVWYDHQVSYWMSPFIPGGPI